MVERRKMEKKEEVERNGNREGNKRMERKNQDNEGKRRGEGRLEIVEGTEGEKKEAMETQKRNM